MKTLDEVIKDLEECMKDDAIESEGFYLASDSLQYLREYRDMKNALDVERKETIEAYRQWQDAKEKLEVQTSWTMWADNHFQLEISDNPPLTWDELKFMKGKPVWVEMTRPGYLPWSGWEVIDHDGVSEKFMSTYRDDYAREQQGKTWQAYRKERNENAE